MKTNRLKFLFIFCLPVVAGAEGLNTFACLRDLIPVTEQGTYQRHRRNVEKPFAVGTNYLAFPEVKNRKLTGFYLYDAKGAWYFDTAEILRDSKLEPVAIASMTDPRDLRLYQMVAQPRGLETITIHYMPAYSNKEAGGSGPVMLGTSVLPVIGAFMSRPGAYDEVYLNPAAIPESRLEAFVTKSTPSARAPAALGGTRPDPLPIERILVKLATSKQKSQTQLWQPLQEELRLRREWVKTHNLDDQTFKELSRAMDGNCKEKAP